MKAVPHPIPLILALCTLMLGGCKDDPAQGATASSAGTVTEVDARVIQPEALIDRIQALGTAKANESISITPRIESVVSRILFEEDQMVRQGDLLLELESSELRAGLAVAEAKLQETTSTFNRNKSLKETQAISASSLDQLYAAMQVDKATVNAMKARLDHARIRAPFGGRIGLRRVSPGGFVDTDTVITTLDDTLTIKLDFSVPETFLPVMSEGMTIEARSRVFPHRVFTGRVTSIDTRVDPVTRSIMIRALLPNDDAALKPGMFLTVDVQRDQGQVLLAPEESIVPEGGKQFVYVAQDGVAHKREVALGRRMPGVVEILSGLAAGEMIITEGTIKLHDGAAVKVVSQAAANSAPTSGA